MSAATVFARADDRLGSFALRPLDPDADAPLLHGWVTHPKSAFWMMGDADVERVRDEYRAIAGHPHHDAFIGLHDGRPAFLAERYDGRGIDYVDCRVLHERCKRGHLGGGGAANSPRGLEDAGSPATLAIQALPNVIVPS